MVFTIIKKLYKKKCESKTLYLYFCMHLYISPVVKKEYNFSTKNDTDFTLRLTSWISELGKLSNILTVQGISETEKNTKSYFHDKIHMIKHIFFSLYNYLYKSNFVCFLSPFLGHWRVMLWFWIFFFLRMCYLSTCVYIGSLHALLLYISVISVNTSDLII